MVNNLAKVKPNLKCLDYSESGCLTFKFKVDYAVDDLEEESFYWQFSNYEAVEYYLSDYEIAPNSSNFEQIRGYLEAFYHLISLEDWDNAWLIASIKLNTPSKECKILFPVAKFQTDPDAVMYSIVLENSKSLKPSGLLKVLICF